MDITPELREHAKTCAVCRSQLMMIEAAKAKVAMAVAMLEWARLIRAAEDQDTLLAIADDVEVNARRAGHTAEDG